MSSACGMHARSPLRLPCSASGPSQPSACGKPVCGSPVRIQVDLGSLRRIRWHEYVVRFVLGGAVTVATGLIAKAYGPVVGGLFLAFPAIFPASATLLDKHEREEKSKAGFPNTI